MRLDVQAPGYRWIAETDGSVAEASWLRIHSLTVRAVQSEWSGDVMELLDGTPMAIDPDAEPVPFQYPGLVVYEPRTQRFAICFGDGRWRDGFGPLRAVPVARVVSDLDRLREFGKSLQFVGAQQVTISVAENTTAEESSGIDTAAEGRSIEVGLGDTVARGVLLERTSPRTAAALGELLPLTGKATNTYASGPLTRFWNDAGGAEGAVSLDVDSDVDSNAVITSDPPHQDQHRSVAAPGFVYYMPSSPWNGLRIAARDATVMRGPLPGGDRSRLVPVVELVGDWSAFRGVAANLRFSGALPMFVRLSG